MFAGKNFANAQKYIKQITSAGRSTKGSSFQRIGTGGRKSAEKLFRTLTGRKGNLNKSKTEIGKLKDGSTVNIRTKSLSNGAKRTTVEIQKASSKRKLKVRYDE